MDYFFRACEEDFDVLLPYDSPFWDYGIGGDAFAVIYERDTLLIWMNKNTDVCFSLCACTNRENANYSLDDLIAMAESVEKQ